MRCLLTALLIMLALPLAAQDESTAPSPSVEPFSVLPNKVKAGAKALELRLAASSQDLFASSSVKSPTIVFGAGVTAVEGSFRILNSSEAGVSINVADDALGGIEVRINFYSKDGASTIRQERATLGVIADAPVAETGISIGAERVNLVAVNVTTEQTLGAIVAKGRIKGTYTFTPPVGMTFKEGETPVVNLEGGTATLSNLTVATGRNSFTFTIINTASDDLTMRIDNLVVETANFGSGGGTLGNQVSTLKGTSFGADEVLVINAHTALTTLTGDKIIADEAATNADTTSTPDGTDTTTGETADDTTGLTTNPQRRASVNRSNTSNQSNRDATSTAPAGDSSAAPSAGGPSNFTGVAPRPSGIGSAGGRFGGFGPSNGGGDNNNGGGAAAPISSGGPSSGSKTSDGPIPTDLRKATDAERSGMSDKSEPDLRSSTPTKLVKSNKLYFADANYKRMENVVLDTTLRSMTAALVWVVLERSEDISDQVDTITVQIRMGDQLSSVVLTETGPKTGIFHSEKRGIAVTMTGK